MLIRNSILKMNFKILCYGVFLFIFIGELLVSDQLEAEVIESPQTPKGESPVSNQPKVKVVKSTQKSKNDKIKQAVIEIRVGNDVITNIDIENRCHLIAIFSSKENNTEFTQSIRKQTIHRLIDEVLYEQLAKQAKIDVSEENFRYGLADYAQRFQLDCQQFETELKKKHIFESFRKMVRAKIISSYLLTSALPKEFAEVTEQQIDAEIEKINQDEKRKRYFISEIVFCSRSNASQQEKLNQSSAKLAAQQTYEELVRMSQKISSTEAFQILAQQLSQGPTALDGGVRGWVAEGQMDDAMAKAVTKLSIGRFSKPVSMRNGEYRIFLLQDIKEPGKNPYSQARLSICYVQIPFNTALSEEAQQAINRKVAALMDCNSASELQSNAKEFGYTSSIIEKKAGNIAIPISDLHFNHCLPPFFTGKSLILYMPLSISYPRSSQNFDRDAIKNELIYRKKSVAADKILKDFKNHVLIQYLNDNNI